MGLGLQAAYGAQGVQDAIEQMVAAQRRAQLDEAQRVKDAADLKLRQSADTRAGGEFDLRTREALINEALVKAKALGGLAPTTPPATAPGTATPGAASGVTTDTDPTNRDAPPLTLTPVPGAGAASPAPGAAPASPAPFGGRQTVDSPIGPIPIHTFQDDQLSKMPTGVEVPVGGTYAERDANGKLVPVLEGAPKPPGEPTEGALDAAYQAAKAKQVAKLGLTKEEQMTITGYEERKKLVPETTFNLNQPNKDNARLDSSYKDSTRQLDSLRKPIQDQAERLAKLNTSLSQMTPQADTLLAPELLVVMAGGAGSGVRINNAEIENTVGGKTNWQKLKSAIGAWSLDESKAFQVTPEQRVQIRDLIREVGKRNHDQLGALDAAGSQLIDAETVADHRRAIATAKAALEPKGPEFVRDANGNLVLKGG